MPLERSRVRAICFDVDGTLSDTDDQFVARLVRLLHPVRFLFQQNDPRPLARRFVMATESPGNLLFGLPDRVGLDAPLAKLGDAIYRLGLGGSPKRFLLIPGVDTLLERLARRYPMAIVSARGSRSTQWFLKQFNLQHYFQCVATAQTVSI
jgi:phosphoglycolate phosphatase-like HAD superfamily hydrolase